MKTSRWKTGLLGIIAIAWLVVGPIACATHGPAVNTEPGQQLTEEMFHGEWDLDGERTNTANGNGGLDAIPSDVVKDVLGNEWRFKPNGVLKTAQTVGWKTGTWRLEGTETLVVNEGSGEQKYVARFQEGCLYLKKADGKNLVFERDED